MGRELTQPIDISVQAARTLPDRFGR